MTKQRRGFGRGGLAPCFGVYVLLQAAGCGDRSTPDASSSAAPEISAETAVIASASGSSASVTAPPATPLFVVRTSFDLSTSLHPVEKSFIACTDGCATGTTTVGTAETFVVDRADTKKVPLFPEGAWRAQYGRSGVFNDAHRVAFYGTYPGGKLYATLDAPYDRGGYGGVSDLVSGPSGWQISNDGGGRRAKGCIYASWVAPSGDRSGCSEPFRKLLPKLARAPFRVHRVTPLPDGSSLILFEDGFARSDKLEKKHGPWRQHPSHVTPLTDGSVLVVAKETLYRVMPNDSSLIVEVRQGEVTKKLENMDHLQVYMLNDEPWLAFREGNKRWLAMTSESGRPKAFYPPPSTPTEREAHDIPLPTKLEDSCATPFVILSSNKASTWVFDATMRHFYADPSLQDDATFMSIWRNNGNYFGVQLKTREGLKKVQKIAEEKRIKPQLTCLDALSKISDPTNPPLGVEVYFANLAQGQLLSP